MSGWAIFGIVVAIVIVLVVLLMLLMELPDFFKYLKLLAMSDDKQPQASESDKARPARS